jgi:hypothetical protein
VILVEFAEDVLERCRVESEFNELCAASPAMNSKIGNVDCELNELSYNCVDELLALEL